MGGYLPSPLRLFDQDVCGLCSCVGGVCGGIYPLISACLMRMCVACVVVWGRVGGYLPSPLRLFDEDVCGLCSCVGGVWGGIYPLLSACLIRMCVACVVVWGRVWGVFTLSSPPV